MALNSCHHHARQLVGRDWLKLHPHVFEPAASAALSAYAGKVLATSPYAYWPLNESGGATAACQISSPAQDGTYTGVTLGQTGIGDGLTAPLFDGVNDFCSVYTAALVAAFDGTYGTLAFWAKPYDSGVWTDGAYRYLVRLRTDNSNLLFVLKLNSNNTIQFRHWASNEGFQPQISGQSWTAWTHLAMTWDKDAVGGGGRVYINGVQQGSNAASKTWAGALAVNQATIGASNTTPEYPWYGYLAHVALWPTLLPEATIAALATV